MNEIFYIPCSDETKEETLAFLKVYSNDVIIHTIREDSIGITIQREGAEQVYNHLLEEIGKRVYLNR